MRLNNGSWQTANGTTSWSKTFSLVAGTNVIEAISIDDVGYTSTPKSVRVYLNDQWAMGLGGTGMDYAYAVASDTADNIYVTGYFTNPTDFGGGPLTSGG